MPYFVLTVANTPDELVKAATLLLSAVKEQPKLTESFRMEVKISDDSVLFRVCLDTVSWYDVYLRDKPRTEAVIIAKEYITATRKTVPPEEDGPFIVNLNCEDLEKNKAYTRCIKSYYHDKSLCEYDHTEHVCKAKVQTRDSREEICNFYCATKLTLQMFSTKDYIVLLRRDIIRELLLAPCPNKEKDNHCDNEEMLQRTEFWSVLLKHWKLLKFHTMAANFGRWELAQSRDKYTQTCHAHVHLLFNKEDWEVMKEKVTNNELLSKLNIRNCPGPNYLLMDCMELEKQRLQLEESRCMSSSIDKLIDSVNELTKATKTTNDSVDALTKTTKEGFSSLINAINKLARSENSVEQITNINNKSNSENYTVFD
ncbi:hypothetical protein C1645_745686 [Glomus cerebriforme]|uniref:Uncharacterized protein n=1 Tax=Glomus cerebriforme TaxID=658196 RepID=A0A397RZY4_9GLOM|nr:hypothetical protein C1645_745686 [Glomus cerebriforme]